MASISEAKNGTRKIQFVGLDGKRRTIYCGKSLKRIVDELARNIATIVACAAADVPLDVRTADWLGKLADGWHAKLAAVGLVTPRESTSVNGVTFGQWVERFRETRSHLKGGSRMGIDYALNNALAFFGAETTLSAITPGACDDFARWLTTDQQQSPATAGRRIRTIKSVFRAAVRHELLTRNPMEGIKEGSQSNPSRQQFIDRATIGRVLDACPDTEWRLLVALARFGGLRIPSEAVTLRWLDVDWERGRLTVHSPKTEHHPGKDRRQVPLFPELRAALEDRLEIGGDGEFVFDRLRRTVAQSETGWKAVNLRTQFARILDKAGVTPWPRLWVNLRSSCETELAERFPAHVTAAWLGHTPDVAAKHYLQTLDSHFATAAVGSYVESEATQNPTHALSELRSYDAHQNPRNAKTPAKQGLVNNRITPHGHEQPLKPSGNPAYCETGDAPDDARGARPAILTDSEPITADAFPIVLDDDLRRLLDAWPTLTADDRRALADHAVTLAAGRLPVDVAE